MSGTDKMLSSGGDREPAAAADTTRRNLLLGGALLATAGIAFARRPQTRIVAYDGKQFQKTIPDQAGPWQIASDAGFVMPPEDEARAAAVYEDQITRTFVNGVDPAVMFLMAYDRSQSGMLMVHRPESCYPGSGFTITGNRAAAVPLAPGLVPEGRFLSTERGERVEQVLYWTRLGNSFPRSWDEQRREIAMQNLRGLVPDGTLVRVSMIDTDPEKSLATLRRFSAALFAACGRDGRALLGGPANV